MGTSQSREGREFSDSDSDYDEQEPEQDQYQDAQSSSQQNATNLDDVDAKLSALKLKYSSPSPSKSQSEIKTPLPKNAVKLYLHIGGNTPNAKWILSDKRTSYAFVKNDHEEENDDVSQGQWILKVGSKIRARVSTELQLKMFGDQRRVDFVSNGVWALKFPTDESYRKFVTEFQNCTFENVYGLSPTEENKVKVYGKEFIGWVKPEAADDSVWEDAVSDDASGKSPEPYRSRGDLMEEFEEAANGGIQTLTLGALDNSFLLNDAGFQVYRNFDRGIRKGVAVKYEGGNLRQETPSKALLMRAETNMMLMSPLNSGAPHASKLNQLDIETGKIVTEWKFEKDGTDITMRDITNDTKGSQLDPSESTFLGLDDNRLCQWDMRDRKGIVQNIATASSPVLHWNQGHQFSRGTNFQCFATTGDGSIVVGSLDGKIRLYSNKSMRMAKTAFPGLGSPITSVDVTFDGKWVLGTTDTYLVLICTLFTDKDGKTKTGFGGRMGNRIGAPRLLKLTPLDSHLAGTTNKFHGGHFSWVINHSSLLLCHCLLF